MHAEDITRRRFIKLAAGAGAVLCPLAAMPDCDANAPTTTETVPRLSDHEALDYVTRQGGIIRCTLCPHECIVARGARGLCGVRENQGGVYKTLVYARPCSLHVDPIEKKPLFHFLPGTRALSIATAGCNVECQFCQNWDISQALPEDLGSKHVPPQNVVALAKRANCPTIAYTYSEPTVFYEYVLDTARAGKEAGVHSVTISNGYINADPMKRLCEVLSAVKIDLKGFTEKFYQEYVGGQLEPILATIELLKELGMYTELVTLLIPGLNDSDKEIRNMSKWVVKHVGPDVPMHFSQFRPAYKMKNLPQTPEKTVIRAREIAASEGVHYAYVGNLQGHDYENTYCHSCGKKIVERFGYYVGKVRITDGKCDYCKTPIPGVWSA